MEKFKLMLSALKSKAIYFFSTIFAICLDLAEKLVKKIKEFSPSTFFTRFKQMMENAVKNIKKFKISNYSAKQRYLAGFLVICFMVTLSNDFTALSQNMVERPCKVIVVDGAEIVKVPLDFSADLDTEMNTYFRNIENRDIKITSTVEVNDATGYGYEIGNIEEVLDEISDDVNYEVLAVDFRLDDEHIAYVNSIEELTKVLDNVKEPYLDPKFSLVDFKEEVAFDEFFVSKSKIASSDELLDILHSNKADTISHTIVEGDTMWDLSIKNEITVEDLLYNNPNLSENTLLQIGDEIIISTAVPMISVRSYERVVYDDVAPFSTDKVNNDNEFVTYKKVVTEGVNGTKTVTADIVRTNGVESDRLIVDEVIKVAPVNQVIEVGTMNTPPKKAIGTFIMPAPGRISDRFGTRGGRHKGIDIANASGTNIVASDGGRVEYSGWQSGYGNVVIIDHQNGYKTYYGHNSKNLVSVGQMVAQGELIAKMGSTGRSTGNHSHFEVRVSGTPKNPFNYVKY